MMNVGMELVEFEETLEMTHSRHKSCETKRQIAHSTGSRWRTSRTLERDKDKKVK